ncbi:hypothetical protein BJ322DRAFT_1025589 [Thelephora terrestris]|uniref:Uncharacterized protein n=1 Tax=Thelephora terrestris TaxID=56493 RepID=A0A9P6H1X7_9AGAM|nr:hypothetical protein BJ322DRAFT_1025589 [Thelephora terrestris]
MSLLVPASAAQSLVDSNSNAINTAGNSFVNAAAPLSPSDLPPIINASEDAMGVDVSPGIDVPGETLIAISDITPAKTGPATTTKVGAATTARVITDAAAKLIPNITKLACSSATTPTITSHSCSPPMDSIDIDIHST